MSVNNPLTASTLVASSAAVSGLLGYLLHGTDSVRLPLLGEVSAPIGFAVSNALSIATGIAVYASGDIPLPAKFQTPGNEAVAVQAISGLGQSALLKGLSSNSNVGLGESFAVGFVAPLVASELFAVVSQEPSSKMTYRY
jgi:hypothetical protein